jgi:carboxypeptidase Q
MLLRSVPALLFLSSLLVAQAATEAEAPLLPDAMAEAIAKEGIDNSQVMRLLRDLTGKVGHRLTGSDNFTKGALWAVAEFQAMGLDVELVKWGQWKLVWNRGKWHGRITQPIQLDMYVATDAWTAGTKGLQKAEVVAFATGDAQQAEVKGNWVIGRRRPRAQALASLQEEGALGFVYRAGDPNAEFPTRVRVFGNNQTAMKTLEQVPTFPEIAVQADHFDQLFALVEEGKKVECEFQVDNSFREGPIHLHNVVATLRGSEKPDEWVVVSSHLDSWHQVQGTTDNGTGTTTTMEAARILTSVGAKPKRSIKFCLWGGEEQGLLGSRGWVQRNRTEMPKVSACFNHDTGTNWAHSLGVTQAMADQLAPFAAQVNRLLKAPDANWEGDVFKFNVRERVSGGGGSDHASFIAAGVPGLDWGLKGRSNYFNHTWHTQWDTIDVAIEEYQRHTATVIAMFALGTANLPALLDRTGVVPTQGSGGGQAGAYLGGFLEAEFDELKVKSVKEGGRGAVAGLRQGDVLKKVAGEVVEEMRHVFRLIRDAEGDEIAFTFQRGDATHEVKLKKADLPAAPGRRRGGDQRPADTVPPGGGQGTPAPSTGGSGGSGNNGGGGGEDALEAIGVGAAGELHWGVGVATEAGLSGQVTFRKADFDLGRAR